MKKQLLILSFLCLFLAGCSTISYETDKGKFTYTRFGAQSIKGLEVTKDKEGYLIVTLDKNDADSGDLGKALADISAVAKSMSAN